MNFKTIVNCLYWFFAEVREKLLVSFCLCSCSYFYYCAFHPLSIFVLINQEENTFGHNVTYLYFIDITEKALEYRGGKFYFIFFYFFLHFYISVFLLITRNIFYFYIRLQCTIIRNIILSFMTPESTTMYIYYVFLKKHTIIVKILLKPFMIYQIFLSP